MATTKNPAGAQAPERLPGLCCQPKKTEIFRGDALDRLMHYTQNEDKTEHQLYVTGFNCDPQNACLIMEQPNAAGIKTSDTAMSATILFRALSPAKPARTKCIKSAAN